MKISSWLKINASSLEGKTIVITGTTSGLGLATLEHLASVKANVIVGVRNTEKAKKQIEELKIKAPNFSACVFELDLTDKEKIISFAKQVQENCPEGIDALINNAGIFAQKKQILNSGFEKHFFVNTIAPILLTKILLPSLEKRENSKIVFVSSISFLSAKVNFSDIDLRTSKDDIKTYANSKRWLTFFAIELKTELERNQSNVTVSICHPGISSTSLMSSSHGRFSKGVSAFLSFGMKCVFPSVKKASLNEIFALCVDHDKDTWIGPSGLAKVYGKPKIQKLKIKMENENISEDCYNKLSEIVENLQKS